MGLCDKADFEVVKKHKSMAVIIWDGYLIRQKLVGKYQAILSGSNIYHLTISNNIAELGDLFRINLIPTQIVVSVVDLNFYYPTQLGPSVFVATDSQYPEKYGEIYYIKMQKIFPNIKFVIVSSNDNAEKTTNEPTTVLPTEVTTLSTIETTETTTNTAQTTLSTMLTETTTLEVESETTNSNQHALFFFFSNNSFQPKNDGNNIKSLSFAFSAH